MVNMFHNLTLFFLMLGSLPGLVQSSLWPMERLQETALKSNFGLRGDSLAKGLIHTSGMSVGFEMRVPARLCASVALH